MRNRPNESDPSEIAGHARRESALVVSGFLFLEALRPMTFILDQAWVALRPMWQILGLGEWQQTNRSTPRRR